MKASLAIKTLFRTMGKTLFTFLLIAVLTFSLFIQLSEYCRTAAEFENTVSLYKGTGYVEYRPAVCKNSDLKLPNYIKTDPRVSSWNQTGYRYTGLSAETAAELLSLPGVSAQKRYMTAGVSDTYLRVQDDKSYYDYNNRIIVEGTLDRCDLEGGPRYYLRDAKILAGDASIEDITYDDGTMYFSAASPRSSHYRSEFAEGERYVVVCRFLRHETNRTASGGAGLNFTRESLELTDELSEHACPAVWNVTDAPENYLEKPEYAPLQKLVELTEADLHTFDVVYAEDMGAIRQVHENTLYIVEGRWLTPEDTANDAKVCVLDRVLAQKYYLELGDRLSLKLGNALFEQFYSLGALACTEERFADEWTADEFEIVGFYTGSTLAKNANEPNWAYSMNTVFVPLASLPVTEAELADHEFAPGEITFRVDNAWDIAAFLKVGAPRIEELGLKLSYDDGGWMPLLEEYRDAQRIPMVRILLLAFVTVTGLALSVYLFVTRKKKDYAIMRALGTPKGRSAKALLIPITVLTAAAVLIAVAAGLVYSRVRIGAVFLLPVGICIAGALACTLLFAAVSLFRLGRKPPLLLLQDAEKPKKAPIPGKESGTEAGEGTLYSPAFVKLSTEPLPITRRAGSLHFRLRYIIRHVRRQGLKSALSLLLAALLVGAVVQFASLRDTYDRLRETTEIPVQYINSLSYTRLQPLVEEGLARDVYYERTAKINYLNGTEADSTQLMITSDIERCVGQEYEITLGEGYTADDIGKLDHVLVGTRYLTLHKIEPGDVIRFGTEYDLARAFTVYTEKYLEDLYGAKGLEPPVPGEEDYPTREQVYARYRSEIDRKLDQVSASAVVIGSIQMKNYTYQNAMFTAGIDDGSSLVGTSQTMPLIEFTLSDNNRLEEMRQRGEKMTYGRKGAFVMDTEALENNIRTSDLLNELYLPVIALALLIGAALCALLVMQSGKEAAIMRALGTTKRTTRSMLSLEQILLGVAGILLGLLVMLAWKRGAFSAIAVQAGLFALAYLLVLILGSYGSAGLATRKNILELLQTKE